MSAAQRVQARRIGKQHSKDGFICFKQFATFMRELKPTEEFSSEQITVAWATIQKSQREAK